MDNNPVGLIWTFPFIQIRKEIIMSLKHGAKVGNISCTVLKLPHRFLHGNYYFSSLVVFFYKIL